MTRQPLKINKMHNKFSRLPLLKTCQLAQFHFLERAIESYYLLHLQRKNGLYGM